MPAAHVWATVGGPLLTKEVMKYLLRKESWSGMLLSFAAIFLAQLQGGGEGGLDRESGADYPTRRWGPRYYYYQDANRLWLPCLCNVGCPIII